MGEFLTSTATDTDPAIRRTGVTEYRIETAASVRLDVGGPDHLAPLLGFVGDETEKWAKVIKFANIKPE